ncbi:hypothetical protein Y032_0005g2404 [Ancylostoma ceylanicum]|uniref:Uncharacterized protein n=1 Tax=Ancylostoma ceylanicum TaxID=53326 RepID=A0A016VRM0_9BILA|nr:hypothetical protein Y032_0005g2404 [Ancylostoma ceylanicum]
MYMCYRQLKDGDVIYNVGTAGTCTDCPAGTSCDPTSKLCAPTSTTTTPSPATSTTTPTTTTTTPPPAVTTTPPTSSEASFPTGPWLSFRWCSRFRRKKILR